MDEPPAHAPFEADTGDEASTAKGGKAGQASDATANAKGGKGGDRNRRGHLYPGQIDLYAPQADNSTSTTAAQAGDNTTTTAAQGENNVTAQQTAGVVGDGDRDILIMRVVYGSKTPSYCDESCVLNNMWAGSPSVDSMCVPLSQHASLQLPFPSTTHTHTHAHTRARAHTHTHMYTHTHTHTHTHTYARTHHSHK
jgi:hypothetical protein